MKKCIFIYQFGDKNISVFVKLQLSIFGHFLSFSPTSSSSNIKSTIYIKKYTVRIPVKSYIESERQGYTKTSFIMPLLQMKLPGNHPHLQEKGMVHYKGSV